MQALKNTIKHEQLCFSLIGFGLAGTRLLSDGGELEGRSGATLWTLFAVVLGV